MNMTGCALAKYDLTLRLRSLISTIFPVLI